MVEFSGKDAANCVAEVKKITDGKDVHSVVVFSQPGQPREQWQQAPAIEQARKLHNATIVIDDQGHEGKQFGISCSGQCLVYDQNGNLKHGGSLGSASATEAIPESRKKIAGLLPAHDSAHMNPQSLSFSAQE